MRRIVAVAALLVACSAGETVHDQPFNREAPACSSCAFAHEVCIEIARAETLAEITAEECGLVVCLTWYRQRVEACDESYILCSKGCGQ